MVGADKLVDDRESQAASLIRPVLGIAEPSKSFEDAVAIFRINPSSVVGHIQDRKFSFGPKSYVNLRSGVAFGVVDQVAKYL